MKKSLKEYHKKRDFNKTDEPDEMEPIFVIQEHHASHLHYDFRLELDGVLKSWAIPKGPSMDPDDKRLAIEVEDHPLSYASFHGTIPEGQYGAGEVYIWDKGTWNVKGDAHQGIKKGKLEFSLSGKKLKGNFVLIRLPDRGNKKHQWLLKKMEDSTTKKKVVYKNWPGFISPQLAILTDSPPKEKRYVHEIKFDGYRLQSHVKNGEVKIFTRNALNWSEKFPTLLKAFSELGIESAILDGEAVVLDRNGKSHFSLLQDALSREDDSSVKLFLFDLFYLNGEDLRKLSLKKRKEKLRKIIPKNHPVIRFSEDVNNDAESFYKLSCKHDLEGIISKDSTAPYFKGRSKLWYKTKCTHRQELVVGGYTIGKGSRGAEIGALLLGVYDRNKFRYVGKVGSGFNRQSLRELKEKVEKLEQQSSAFDINSPNEKEIHWLKPKLVAEVSFTEWTSDSSLRHPVFIGLREDKGSKEVVVEDVELSHPKKIIFPAEKITKQDVANYYEEIASVMLPYVKDRPLSLVRCPSGGAKKCFYQKHPHIGVDSKNLKTFKVKEKSKTTIYTALDSKVGLKHLVQMNAFEIHLWNCRYDKLMNPDLIILDLDPDPGVSFKQVVQSALLLKKILLELKLKSFVKTTGGKGLHVHIPIEPIYSWDKVKAFSKALAEAMVSHNPKLYISTMSKKNRKGKIFIDYFRNNFGETSVAPYSLRAKKNSAVAMPIEWSELPRIKSADQFTLKKALLKVKRRKSDPWKKYFSLKQRIHIFDK